MRLIKMSFILVFLLSVSLGYSQKNTAEILLKKLAGEKHDTIKCIVLCELSHLVFVQWPDSAFNLATQAYNVANESNYRYGKGRAFFQMAIVRQSQTKYDDALNYINQAVTIFENIDRKAEVASSYNTRGLVHFNRNEFPKALEDFIVTIKKYGELNDIAGQAMSTGNIGLVYYKDNNFEKCLEYWGQAVALDEKANNEVGVARNTGNIANVYFKQGTSYKKAGKKQEAKIMFDKAIAAYNVAYKLTEKKNNKPGLALIIGNMANMYYEMGDKGKTIEFYDRAYKIYESLGDKMGMSTQMGNMGWIYYEQKDYKNAEAVTKKAIEIVKGLSAIELIYNWYDNLTLIYEGSGDIGSAYECYKRTISLRDSIYSIDAAKKTLETQMNFEFDKKEAIVKEEQAKQAIIRNAFIAGFALMLIMAIIVFRGYRNKQKANKAISEQKELLEIKNKEITDSIRYAKRIQNAHLPSNDYISKKLTELKKQI